MQKTKSSSNIISTRTILLLVVLQIVLLDPTSSSRKQTVLAFQINHQQQHRQPTSPSSLNVNNNNNNNNHQRRPTRCSLFKNKQKYIEDITDNQKQIVSSYSSTRTTRTCNNLYTDISRHVATISLSISILLSSSSILLTLPTQSYAVSELAAPATTIPTLLVSDNTNGDKSYDGFAEYAKENQMEQSDVGCFINKCGIQTKELFQNPRGIKGIVCLGQCKGEQVCATRCFAEYGSNSLNNWLSCTIEDNECVKVPKSSSSTIDNSAEEIGYSTTIKKFNPTSLVGTWYKTNGLNPNYDLFDCQTNTFALSKDTTASNKNNELDMGIFFRVQRPIESGGGYWENSLTEHMVVDSTTTTSNTKVIDTNDMNSAGRTMHTSGKMYGLQFSENWYILGESDGSSSVPEFKLVAYKGHTLQGNYEGAFVYAKTSQLLSESAINAVSDAASKAGLDFTKFTPINNSCPSGIVLNDIEAGTGTSTNDWIQLLIGEGGVIDWISPGWRGEYNKNIIQQTQTTQTRKIISSTIASK